MNIYLLSLISQILFFNLEYLGHFTLKYTCENYIKTKKKQCHINFFDESKKMRESSNVEKFHQIFFIGIFLKVTPMT